MSSTPLTPKQQEKLDRDNDKLLRQRKLDELQRAHAAADQEGKLTISKGHAVPCPKSKSAIEVTVKSAHPAIRALNAGQVQFAANGSSLSKSAAPTAYMPFKDGGVTVTVQALPEQAELKYFVIPDPFTVTLPAGELVKATVPMTPNARPKIKLKLESDSSPVQGIKVRLAKQFDLTPTGADGVAALLPADGGLPSGSFEVAIGAAPLYEVTDLANIQVEAPESKTFEFTLRKLARPKIKVVREDNGKVVHGVGVKLGDKHDLGLTDGKGIAALAKDALGVQEGDYPVTLIFKGRGLEHYVPADADPKVTIVRGAEDEYVFKVKTANLLVIVRRADGKPLPKHVKFDLAGPTALTDQETAACSDPDDKREEKKLEAVAPGDYTVTIKNLATVLTDQKSAPTSKEKWTLGPDKTGVLKVTVTANEPQKVEFMLTKYRKVQPVAFNIKPGTKNVGGIEKYLGEQDSDADIKKRNDIMIEAMRAAHKHGSVEDDEAILKVFMAPEFYYRGAEGAYPVDKIAKILDGLKAESQKADYKDWLFVFGTAIGYLKHEDNEQRHRLKVSSVTAPDKVKVIAGADPIACCDSIISNTNKAKTWRLLQGQNVAPVKSAVKLNATTYELTVADSSIYAAADCSLIEGKALEYGLAVTLAPSTPTTIVRVTGGAVKASVCSRIPADADPAIRWQFVQGVEARTIERADMVTADEYDLTLASPVTATNAPCTLIEPVSTEVYNVALVQKGGSGAGSTGLREAAIYKEFVSAIDFLGKQYGQHDDFHEDDGSGREIDIHDDPSRTVLPTMGATDKLGGKGNTGSEVNKSGIGGGSIFSVDGISFGLEVCRDHLVGRLANYYARQTRKGEPKIQVQLIPSWGASIDPPGVIGLKGSLVFNVDGPAGSFASTTDGWECKKHTGVTHAAPGPCPTVDIYYCDDVASHTKPAAGACPGCGKALKAKVLYRYCPEANHHYLAPAVCPGGHPTSKSYGCSTCNSLIVPNSSGKCPTCGGTPDELNTCSTEHRFTSGVDCIDCGKPLQDKVAHYYCGVNFHTSATAGNCPICTKAFKAWHNKMDCKLSPLGAIGGTPPVPNPSGAVQSVLFENTGSISVYPAQDVPEAESLP